MWEPLVLPGILRLLLVRVQDMNREVVKTDCASARIPELDFEIPAFSQKGGGYMGAGFGGLPGCVNGVLTCLCPFPSAHHHRGDH